MSLSMTETLTIFMKKRRPSYNTLAISLLCCILSSGCHTRSDLISDPGSPPTIQSVQTIKTLNGSSIATSSFRVGETGNFLIVASDMDKDIEKLYVKGYAPGSPDSQPTLVAGPIELTPQKKKIASYSLPEDIDVPTPPGRWRVDIQLEDKENNMSNIYTLYTIIH
jgi:hypothetical protein